MVYLTIILAVSLCACEASEYFVKPTVPATETCPGQPCFTLNYYNNHSSNYFKSNSTFKFLAGIHYVDKPIMFKAVKNISLESYVESQAISVHLVTNFTAKKESQSTINPHVINFESVDGIIVQGIAILSALPKSFALVLNNTKSVHLVQTSFMCRGFEGSGLSLQNSYSVTIKITNITNCSNGISLTNSAYVTINNLITEQNNRSGIILSSTSHAVITNITSIHNSGSGITVDDGSHNTTIQNADCSHNGVYGITVLYSSNTTLNNVTAQFSKSCGLYIGTCNFTSIEASIFSYNNQDGVRLERPLYVTISNITANYNYDSGIFMNTSRNININSSFASYNFNGIVAYYVSNISISNSVMTNSSGHSPHRLGSGLMVLQFHSLHISNCTMTNSDNYGITASYGDHITIEDVLVKECDYSGIFLSYNTNNFIKDVTVIDSYMNIVLHHSVGNYISEAVVTSTEGSRGLTMYSSSNTFIEGMRFLPYSSKTPIILYIPNMITESVILTNCTNATMTIHMSALQRGVSIYNSTQLTIHDSNFSKMEPLNFASDPTSLSSIILLYYSSLTIENCTFTRNDISAIKLFSSTLTLSGSTHFVNNTSPSGTAFILSKDSVIRPSRNSQTTFINNHATDTGGVFYIETNLHYIVDYVTTSATVVVEETLCFLQLEEYQYEPLLIFVNNTAGYAGDLVYGGQIANGWDGDQNCLLMFQNISKIVPPVNELSLISSDPSRICLCNDSSGLPDCLNILDSQVYPIYPGQYIEISAVVTGQTFGTVSGSVYAQFLEQSPNNVFPQLEPWQYTQGVDQYKCNNLSFTISSNKRDISSEVLVLTADNGKVSNIPSRERVKQTIELWKSTAFNKSKIDNTVFTKEIFEYPVYVNISVLPCPLGFQLTDNPPYVCDCNNLLQTLPGVECSIQHKAIIRSGYIWVGVVNETIAISKYCPQGYCHMGQCNTSLVDPNTQCNYNRAGILCGGCKPGLSITLGDNHCEICSNRYLALLIPFGLAGITLVFFIKILDLTVSQGTINALILYANIIQANKYIFLSSTTPLSVFIAWLNLDVGLKTCLFNGMTAYSNTWLQFLFPLYIWTIAVVIIMVAKYSDRMAKLMGNNSVPVLATLFLLSYAKLLRAIITALSYRIIYTTHGSKAVWAGDGNLDYLGYKHTPLFVVASIALLFLWLPYTLLLFLGQWLQKCNYRRVTRVLVQLKPFLDAHYAPFKGDHRYWFGALLLLRATILLISALSPADNVGAAVYSISVSSILATYIGLMVYHSVSVMMFETSFFVNLGLISQTSLLTKLYGGREDVGVNVLIGVAFVQFLGLVFYKIVVILKQREKLRKFLRKRTSTLSEEDWEKWEQAALLRETDSGSEDEEMLSPTVDMVPVTYGI